MANKKILILTYYWPPSGGTGVQRWLHFTRYLKELGWDPIIFTPSNPEAPVQDPKLLAQIPEGVEVLKIPIWEPTQLYMRLSGNKGKKLQTGFMQESKKKPGLLQRFSLYIRANLFIPDAKMAWIKPASRYLTNYLQTNEVAAIISTGPPHTMHLIARNIKRANNLPWLADFRDPWTTIGYHKSLRLSYYAAKKHKKLESQVLNSADTIIVTSKTTKSEFQALTNKPIAVITNGFDVEKVEKQIVDTKFSLAHIGSFLSERNPRILWESLVELCSEIPDFKNHLEIKLIGAVSQEVLETISAFGLNQYLNNLGYVSHAEAVAHQRKSQVLLLIEIDSEETKSILPGKLFEYLVSERPIVAIGPKDSDFAEIITNTNTGVFFDYSEKARLKQAIQEYYTRFLEGNLQSQGVGLQQYSRKNLTQQLVELLDQH